MNKLPIHRHHLPPPGECNGDAVPEKETATALTAGAASLFDVCRCPKCEGPMTARNGPRGPYFHCLCFEITKPQPSTVVEPECEATIPFLANHTVNVSGVLQAL